LIRTSPAKKIKEERKNYADQDAGRQGKINADTGALNYNIPGQPTQPGDIGAKDKDHPNCSKHEPRYNKQFPQFAHVLSEMPFSE